MKTQVLPIDEQSLALARQLILDGQVVAFPTETVYGLGANAFDEEAVDRIYLAKGRPSDNPLIVHISDKKMFDLVARDISPDAHRIIDSFMPGSITVVLNKLPSISDKVTANLPTVAVRMPKSKQARDFISACGVPIAAPSANKSGRPSPTNAQDVFEDMNNDIPLILKGDDCAVGIESTVIDMTGEPRILRPGIVTESEFETVLNKKVEVITNPKSKVNSPGVRYSHYRPNCPVVLDVDGDLVKVKNAYDELLGKGYRPVILALDKHKVKDAEFVSLGVTDVDAARNLFTALRYCEKHYDFIIEVFCEYTEVGASVYNRIIKSASGKILE